MDDRHVAVVAATIRESTRIARQLADFLGPDDLVETQTIDAPSDDGVRAVIVVRSDPGPGDDAGRDERRADLIPVRYNLTKDGWRTFMKAARYLRGASVGVVGDTLAAATRFSEALRRLEVEDLELEPVVANGMNGRRFDFAVVSASGAPGADVLAQEIVTVGPLVLSPAVIADLLFRLGRYDDIASAKLRRYLDRVKLVRDDYTGLLDLARVATERIPAAEDVRARPDSDGSPDRPGAGDDADPPDEDDPPEGERSPNGPSSSNRPPYTGAKYTLDDIVGQSPALKEAKAIVERLRDRELPVLLYGESGTGKEMFAQAIHNLSPRRTQRFVAVNCVAIPETLAESELFGYEEGAFTGAKKGGKEGLFERAHRGTIFLDEISNMSLEIQARLLRVLEDGRSLRVGGLKSRQVNVRVIAASNEPLDELVKRGRFRQDLFFRLCVIPIHLPPLRERIEDIPVLVRIFLAQMGETRTVSPAVMTQLMAYSWPGNARELRHCLDYMRTVAGESPELKTFPPHIARSRSAAEPVCPPPPAAKPGLSEPPAPAGGNDPSASFPAETVRRPRSGLLRADVLLLAIIDEFNAVGRGIGRRSLVSESRRYGVHLTESQVRARLSYLRARGLVEWGLGRGGAKLTAQGHQLLIDQRSR